MFCVLCIPEKNGGRKPTQGKGTKGRLRSFEFPTPPRLLTRSVKASRVPASPIYIGFLFLCTERKEKSTHIYDIGM